MNTPSYTSWYLSYKKGTEPWAYIDNVFDDAECEEIINLNLSNHVEMRAATINNVKNVDNDYRRSRTGFILADDRSGWIFEKLVDAINFTNKKFFEFELSQIDCLQLTEYDSANQGCYKKHIDMFHSGFTIRKLSFTVQLSDPASYTGGDLLLHFSECPDILKKQRGTVLFFPSWVLHEVTSVTSGKRHSLVGWVSGPKFK